MATFTPKDTVGLTYRYGLQAAAVGTAVSAIQNSLSKHNHGALGVFTRTGSTIGLFAAMGAGFTFVDAALANFRQKEDALNGAAGGCAAGFLAGLKQRSLPTAFGACAIVGAAVGTLDATGRSVTSTTHYASKEEKEEARLGAFKSRPLLESVYTDGLKKRGIDVEAP